MSDIPRRPWLDPAWLAANPQFRAALAQYAHGVLVEDPAYRRWRYEWGRMWRDIGAAAAAAPIIDLLASMSPCDSEAILGAILDRFCRHCLRDSGGMACYCTRDD